MDKKGFTLIETIIVIMIIVILSALVFNKHNETKVNNYKKYQLQNGEVVKCKYLDYRSDAGIYLAKCENGNEYQAQTNVTILN